MTGALGASLISSGNLSQNELEAECAVGIEERRMEVDRKCSAQAAVSVDDLFEFNRVINLIVASNA